MRWWIEFILFTFANHKNLKENDFKRPGKRPPGAPGCAEEASLTTMQNCFS
jgi:hypothetical protein